MATLSASNLGDDYLGQERLHDYTWIFAIDIIFAFAAAYGIGANDVANAFGTSVASRAITMRQAIFIASIFEFTGAFFLGAQVTSTISGGIAKGAAFQREPELLMYGMMCVDLGVAIWLWIATYLELPVSTTHSVVGAVIGMALTLKGPDAVIWNEHIDDFPYIKGVTVIVVSWFTSPLLSALSAMLLFFLVRTFVLRASNSFDRSFICLPIIFMITMSINIMFLIQKAGKNYGSGDIPQWQVQLYAWGSGLVGGIIVLCLMPLLKKKVLREKAQRLEAAKTAEVEATAAEALAEKDLKEGKVAESHADGSESPQLSWFQTFKKNTVDRDVHQEVVGIAKVDAIHAHGERFDPDAEEVFKYLQVFTACCNSLAHGANDVANAIGPLAAVAQIWKTGTFSKSSPVDKWVLAVGGVGIVVGLATYGYNIIRALGLKLSLVTSSRGFTIELGAAMVVLVASNYGLPVSTTHCLVGATVGVGALEGGAGVNWTLFVRMFLGWVMTLVVAGFFTAAVVALGAYSPSAQMAEQIRHYEDGLRTRSNALNYGFMWQAASQGVTPGSVIPASFDPNAGVYTLPVVPDRNETGVYNNKAFTQWRSELWTDAGVWQRTTSWTQLWDAAIGYNSPDWKGTNTTTLSPKAVFTMFDKVVDFAFASQIQDEIKSVLAGDKFLCCDQQYKCCPRKCKWKLVDENCVSKCEGKLADPTCVEEGCSDDDLVASSVSSADLCKIVETADDCPYPMDPTSSKYYIGEKYKSNPITAAPPGGDDKYGKPYTDFREEAYDLTARACPIKF